MRFWTQSTWQLLHMYAYLNQDKKSIINLFHSLSNALPCKKCSNHMQQYLKRFPIDSSTNLFKWTVDFHNEVNKRTNKKVITYEEAKQIYVKQIKHNSTCLIEQTSHQKIFFVLIIVILVGLIIISNRKWIKQKLLQIP